MSAGGEAVRHEKPASTRLFLAVVASAVFVTVLTGTMINVVIPLMRAEFGASAAQVGWVITGYALAYAIGVPLYGRISDLFGVRRVFVLGLLGFAAGGLVCAFAQNLPMLVLGRLVQGIGGAAVPALATVAVAKVLPAGKRGGAMGLVASSVGIGAAVGPVVGGAVGQLLGWRALFLGSLVLMLLLIPFARRVLPNGGSEDERRFDLIGGVLLGLGAGLFLLGITQGQAAGFASFSSWGSFLGAALALAGFVWRINRVPHPFVSPALFKNRAYVAALLVGRGWTGIERYYEGIAGFLGRVRTMTVSDLSVDVLGAVAYAFCIFHFEGEIEGESHIADRRDTFILRRESGAWKVIHYHESPPPGPVPMTEGGISG